MRAVLQRVSRAAVQIEGQIVGAIEGGLLILLGIAPTDTPEQVRWLADKVVNLRLFADEAGKMNRSLLEIGGSALIVSQFTLYGDARKGRRPSFAGAAPPGIAIPLYKEFLSSIAALGVPVQSGQFGADMAVSLVNDGPVTLIVDTP
jgi:D-tyrosyl-tRNA(Tyr) deacylase